MVCCKAKKLCPISCCNSCCSGCPRHTKIPIVPPAQPPRHKQATARIATIQRVAEHKHELSSGPNHDIILCDAYCRLLGSQFALNVMYEDVNVPLGNVMYQDVFGVWSLRIGSSAKATTVVEDDEADFDSDDGEDDANEGNLDWDSEHEGGHVECDFMGYPIDSHGYPIDPLAEAYGGPMEEDDGPVYDDYYEGSRGGCGYMAYSPYGDLYERF